MISLTGSATEITAASTLLEIIANPDRTKKHLDDLIAAKLAAIEAQDNAIRLAAEAKEKTASAEETLAQLHRVHDEFDTNHAVRTKTLDDLHAFLIAEKKRLTDYEATITAREKELIEPLAARERAVADWENVIEKREADLKAREAAAIDTQDTYERKLSKLKELTV